MKKLILAASTLLFTLPVYAEVLTDHSVVTTKEMFASQAELGSRIEMIDGEFNHKRVQEAYDKIKGTENVVMYDYGKEKTYPVRMRSNMSTLIVLPKWEKIASIFLADDENFSIINYPEEFQEMQNLVHLQSQYGGIDTNLMLIGESGAVYNFYLRNDPVNSPELSHYTVYVKGQQPTHMRLAEVKAHAEKVDPVSLTSFTMGDLTSEDQIALERAKADYLATMDDKEGVDLDYYTTGNVEIAPRAVYTKDGWTYFDFRGALPSGRLPVPYEVVDGYEYLATNFRQKGDFLVVETVSHEGWSLRNGDLVVCVKKSK